MIPRSKPNIFFRLQPVTVARTATGPTPLSGHPKPVSGLLFSSGGSGDDNKTVRAQRRRRVEPAPPGGRERAEAPARRRTEAPRPAAQPRPSTASQPVSQPQSATSRPMGGSLPSLPIGRMSPLMIVGLLVLACICIGAFMLLSGGLGGGGDDTGDLGFEQEPVFVEEPTQAIPPAAVPARPTNTPRPFVPPAAGTGDETWLVMLYQDADDKILEQDIYVDLNEAERIGSTDQMHIVAQVDRYRGGYQGDGNWSTARRYYITQDSDLTRVNSQMVQDLGEVNMSDGNTLVDFVAWAVETFPADRHVLILSDHGMGWPGGWSDTDSGGRGISNIPLAARIGDQLFLHELDATLQAIRQRTGVEQFEMIGMDACLMGHVEVLAALAPHARYAVVSQETEPALGWAYTSFLDSLARNPGVDGAGLGQLIVDSYIDDDQRIIDDQARAELLRASSPMGGLFGMMGTMSAQQLAAQMGQGITLTAVDLAAIPDLIERVDDLAYVLQGADQRAVAQARTYAQSFTSVWGKEVPPSYLDLGSLVQILAQQSRSADVQQATENVLAAIDQAVIAEKHGTKKPGATGISIYFPNSQVYASPLTGPQSYTAIAERFATFSLWDDFLAYHYAGRRFERDDAVIASPGAGVALRAPGAGEITLSALALSSDIAAPGAPVLMSTQVEGDNVGYAYLFVGFYDPQGNSILVADRDYLESGETRESDGIYYPEWPEGGFNLEFEWEPVVFAIDDGQNQVVALFQPTLYGATFEEAVYTVDGMYSFADGEESRYARLYFSDGYLRQVFGFTGENGTGSPREIAPQTGDRFTVIENWLDVDASGNLNAATQLGDTLTFGDNMFAWKTLDAPQGQYVIGFVVEDLDGNANQTFAQITVE